GALPRASRAPRRRLPRCRRGTRRASWPRLRSTASCSGRAPGLPPPACRRTPWRAGAPPGSWRPLPISMPSPARNPRRTGPPCTAVPGPRRRRVTAGLGLLWRRDITDRLRRLAPYAAFDAAAPVVSDGALWWVSYGYLEAEAFPLVRAVESEGRPVRYLRAALVGAVNAAT